MLISSFRFHLLDQRTTDPAKGYIGKRVEKMESKTDENMDSNGHSWSFFFIKPHAVNIKVEQLVDDFLTNANIEIVSQGKKTAKEMESIIDKHYGILGERALLIRPQDFLISPPSNEALKKFETLFGKSLKDAMEDQSLMNLRRAKIEYLQDLTFGEIENLWRKGNYVKLFPGTYVAAIEYNENQSPIYVINGFYGSMREKFTSEELAPNGVSWRLLRWKETQISWKDFRESLVGATDPSKAQADSLRGILYRNYKQLGLNNQPAGAENGFHASASPLEASHERCIWLGTQLSKDEFVKYCIEYNAELTEQDFEQDFFRNPTVIFEDGGKQMKLFDLVEHLNPYACARALSHMHRDGMSLLTTKKSSFYH